MENVHIFHSSVYSNIGFPLDKFPILSLRQQSYLRSFRIFGGWLEKLSRNGKGCIYREGTSCALGAGNTVIAETWGLAVLHFFDTDFEMNISLWSLASIIDRYWYCYRIR